MSRAYWKTVRLRLATEISYWSCLPIPNLPLSCPPPPPPPLWDRKSLFCWFLLFFICSPLPHSFPGSLFQQTPLFVPYTLSCFTFSVLCCLEPAFRGFDQFSLSRQWLSDWLTFCRCLSLFLYHNFSYLFAYLSFFVILFSFPSTAFRQPCHPIVLPCCSFLIHEWLSFPLLSFYFSSSPPFSQLHQFCSQWHTLVII